MAYPLTDRINTLLLHHSPAHPAAINVDAHIASAGEAVGQGDEIAICVGLDGWHFTRAELDAFPNPAEAHWWRVCSANSNFADIKGAAHTFDLSSYRSFLHRLKEPVDSHTSKTGIPFPTFDHALKDSAQSSTMITSRHRIIMIEGLYTMLDVDGWRECAEIMDMRIYVDVDREISRNRVIRRNFQAGIVEDLDKCVKRGELS